MKKFRAILFDMDGVIIDSEFYWSKIEEKFAVKHGLDYNSRYRRRIMALSPVEIAQVLRKEFGIRESAKKIIAERNKLAREIYQKRAKLLPGFLSMIQKLRRRDYKIALVTSSPRSWIRPILRRFKLKRWFDAIISAENMPDNRGKPHPAIYLFAAKKLGVRPDDCLVFEDSVNGVKAAKAARMFCVAVPDRRWIEDRRGMEEVDLVVKSLRDKKILKILNIRY